jgi:general secretion pathway protein J
LRRPAKAERGFTLVELVIALTVLSLLSLALWGTVSLGARSASIGERKSEQARRYRIATDLIVRQLRSAAPLHVVDEDEEQAQPYFIGESERVSFVTAAPQSPNSSGLAVVDYWYADGVLMMSEIPYFAAFAGDMFDSSLDHLVYETALLFDIRSVKFEYRRSDFDTENWTDKWDAIDEESLQAAVSISLDPDGPDGTSWYHEIPIFVGVMNEVTGEQDFRARRR